MHICNVEIPSRQADVHDFDLFLFSIKVTIQGGFLQI